MRAAIFAVLLSAAAACAQPPIKMPLPCESTTQEIAPSGKHIAVRCKDHRGFVLEVPSGRPVTSLSAEDDFRTFGFSADDKWLAAGNANGEVAVVSIDAGAGPRKWSAGTSNIEFVKFIAPGLLIVSPVRGPAAVWELAGTPAMKARLDTDFASITAADVSPDGKLVVTAGADTVIRFYETATWKKVHEYREFLLEPFAAAFSPDSKYVVVGGADGQLTILDAATGKRSRALPAQADPVAEIRALGADRFCVAYFDADGVKPPHVMVWDTQAGSSKPVTTGDRTTRGGVVNGKIWLASTNANQLELRVGE